MSNYSADEKFELAIVDDHFAIRDGYSAYLSKLTYISGIDCFADAESFLAQLKRKEYNLVLLDIELKNESGLEICRQLKDLYKDMKVLMISTFHSNEYMIMSNQYRADGYIFKDSEPRELKMALEKILFNEGRYYPLEAKEAIFDYQGKFEKPHVTLSDRELRIIYLICEGKSNREIGEMLKREESTIAKHRQNIMNKLNVRKTIEILNYAIKHGLYTPGSALRDLPE